ncbi:DUF2970 domain-containing protein [Oceanicoccus sagamiensis]|uniref:DUF2970 domain-containing protein n=1 Tax=Oceanicoccus sagamiensis TaxID=716816 RepID=A0A1X9NC09_9GAMM|nr:DUF2970 domain-containing protein [Oceanicoccus sagamiensis]ARN73972.1 hypothetical protein BST96_07480 [Oceanicoccus sagamiensis]
MKDDNAGSEEKPLSFFQMVGSVLASFFGVQSKKNKERDFKRGKASQFIAVGILMTAVWYGAIYFLVNVVLAK